MESAPPPAAGTAAAKRRTGLQLPSVADLAGFERSAAAEHLARLEADAELVTQLMLTGYTGPGWNRFALALAEYGVQVIGAWIGGRERLIFAKCAAKGVGGLVPVDYDADEATGLAHETVAKAIGAFREKVLVPGRWKPDKGASLKTFFVGQCLFQFPNIYRKWQRDQATARRSRRAARMDPEFLPPATPVDVGAELHRQLQKLAARGFDSPEALQVAHRFGYSLAEIAEILGTTERAIEGRLYRNQVKAKRDHER